MANREFLVDVGKCTGCNLCAISCKDEHFDNSYAPWSAPQPETGQFWVDVKPLERGTLPRVRVSYMPTFCQHCADAPCIPACPDDAIKTRDDGLVWIDPKACTGCGKCGPACPYDVIFFNEEANIAQKCTGCAHRVNEGLLPRCVEACPHEAILFGDEGAFQGEDSEILKPEAKAAPRVLWRGLPKPWIAGGLIDEERDEVIPNATVTVRNGDDDETHQVLTDEFGDFYVRDLDAGRSYSIEISVDGYGRVTRDVTMDSDRDLGTVTLKSI
ncbi:MAG: 4Fe-4S dicluster domain-containing protein [Alphaproteobacteria bacterium]